ncbi:alpha-N-acetylglucosaminidase [Streptomyces sp. NPDC003042]
MFTLSRRMLIGTASAACLRLPGPGSPAAAWAGDTAHAALPSHRDETALLPPAAAAARRILPRHSDQVAFTRLSGPDRFEVDGTTGRIRVAATTPATALTGLHWYLKYTCNAHLTWAADRNELPALLPAPARPLHRRATLPHRFLLNDTHDGYTAPYADWQDWERLIDIAALHGFNELLITPGHEEVYTRLLLDLGYSEQEARAWIPAPSHQPWWLLQNMSAFGEPMTTEHVARRAELGRRICDRLRELEMQPVLPGWFGTVPSGFVARNPAARTIPQGTWNGLRRPDWLDPRCETFAAACASFYQHQQDVLGGAQMFKMDLLHEGGRPGDVPVAEAARAVETALQIAHPGATWVLLGWRDNPRKEVLAAIDTSRVLIVDGCSDTAEVTDREKDWNHTPYAFGSIPNFGGRTTLGAATHHWTERFAAWRDKSGTALAGTAYMPESTNRDPAAFELFSELPWTEDTIDRHQWFRSYADLRYGGADTEARAAFRTLADTSYALTTADARPVPTLLTQPPSLVMTPGLVTPPGYSYDQSAFDAALDSLLRAAPVHRNSDAYRHDLVDIARQTLANRAPALLRQLRDAQAAPDLPRLRSTSAAWLKLIRLTDDIAGCHRAFMVGPWLRKARGAATGQDEADYLESTARALITTWAGSTSAAHLHGYAAREWNGLLRDLHLPLWQAYLDELANAMAEGRDPEIIDWYAKAFTWISRHDAYPTQATGDAHTTAAAVRTYLTDAPYQAILTIAPDPLQVGDSESIPVTAEFRNLNGFAATGEVTLTLHGHLTTDGLGAAKTIASVPAGGRATAAWQLAPGPAPGAPLDSSPLTIRARYTTRVGAQPVEIGLTTTLYRCGRLAPSWHTHTTNAAVFGQRGDRLAINGSGRDLWQNVAEFGALYRPQSLNDGDQITVRVDAQTNTGPWSRAGIIVRDGIAPAAGAFLNFATTPGKGVVLSCDTDGDGRIDTYWRTAAGSTAPVWLRVNRRGRTYACQYSDDGQTWRDATTVTLPTAAVSQDAGIFMTAATPDTAVRGSAAFSEFTIGPRHRTTS